MKLWPSKRKRENRPRIASWRLISINLGSEHKTEKKKKKSPLKIHNPGATLSQFRVWIKTVLSGNPQPDINHKKEKRKKEDWQKQTRNQGDIPRPLARNPEASDHAFQGQLLHCPQGRPLGGSRLGLRVGLSHFSGFPWRCVDHAARPRGLPAAHRGWPGTRVRQPFRRALPEAGPPRGRDGGHRGTAGRTGGPGLLSRRGGGGGPWCVQASGSVQGRRLCRRDMGVGAEKTPLSRWGPVPRRFLVWAASPETARWWNSFPHVSVLWVSCSGETV